MPATHPMSFTCDVIPERDRARVVPAGELDLVTAPDLDRVVCDLVHSGFARVLVDLTALDFIDSTGLQMLLRLRSAAEARGCRLALRRGAPAVQRLFDVTRTAALFTFE